MGKKLKWNLVLMSILYLGLGIFLLLVPGTAMNIVCYALGGVVLVCAAVQLVRYFAVERGVFQSQLTLISGLVCLGLGAFLIIRSDIVVRILPIVFGLFVIFDSLGRIQNALELRKCQYPSWKGFLLLAVLSIVLGIVMILDPFFHQQNLLFAAVAQQLHGGKDAGRAGAYDDEIVFVHSSFYPLLEINCLPAPLPRSRPHGPAPRRWLRRRRGPRRGQ